MLFCIVGSADHDKSRTLSREVSLKSAQHDNQNQICLSRCLRQELSSRPSRKVCTVNETKDLRWGWRIGDSVSECCMYMSRPRVLNVQKFSLLSKTRQIKKSVRCQQLSKQHLHGSDLMELTPCRVAILIFRTYPIISATEVCGLRQRQQNFI